MKQSIKYVLLGLFSFLLMNTAHAQVTTSSLGGRILDEKGQPVIGAAVIATHEPSGTTYGAVTNLDGRYTIQGMRTGGPYKVEMSNLGYRTITYTDVVLQLGELFSLSGTMKEATEALSEAVVIATPASKFAVEKTGASTNISNRQMMAMPTVSRSITDIAKLSPYGGSGMSFAGMDGRSSNFTVDGANFNNNFGLNDGLPGGGQPISLDAIEEIQVVISPYDVRQTNFIGGGINAVTKSGTNTFKGSAYAYHRNELMRGTIVDGEELSSGGVRAKDRNTTYGFTFGGPIIKNKLFFFTNFEYAQTPTVANRWRPSANGVADVNGFIARTTKEDMDKVYKHLKDKYGYDAGSYTSYPANQSNMKLLARIDWNITERHHLALRYNYTNNTRWNNPNASSSNCGLRTTEARVSQYSMAFANSMYSMNNVVNSATLDLNSRLTDNLSNQFLVTFSKLDDVRGSNSKVFPFIDIMEPFGGNKIMPYISAGYELFTYNNAVHNTVVTFKDDVTWYLGNHKITGGLNYEYQMADNSYMRNGSGYYRYNSLADFLNEATPETVAITYGYDGEKNPAARVRFHQAGLYVQDEWTPAERFKISTGLRLDGLFFDNTDVMTNNAIKALDYGGKSIDTGKWPSANLMVSPRIGFTWDVFGDKSLKVRGGTGFFSGRLPLVFFTNMPTNSGMVQNVTSLTTKYKDGAVDAGKSDLEQLAQFAGPMITETDKLIDKLHGIDPKRFPKTIKPEDGVKPKSIQAVDPDFKMPQIWKTSLAVDYQLPTAFPFTVSGEFIFNKTINGVFMSNWNQRDYKGFPRLNGADNRPVYPSDSKYTGTEAYVLSNTGKGYGYTANLTVNVDPLKNLHLMASYTHTVSKELTGMPGSNAESAFTYTPTVNGPNFAPLHNSQYVTPDRLIASLTYDDKGDNHYSLFYEAFRGGYNYSYMYDNDLNGDNFAYDAIYIPADKSEIKFKTEDDAARYWDFAGKDSYLSKHKGEYAEGYSVYSPWNHRIDFRYAHDFKVNIGKSVNVLQLNIDMKNILNFFNSGWGVAKYMNPGLKSGRILAVDHIDAEGVPVFTTNKAVRPDLELWQPVHNLGQCWYVQVGIKYMFN